MIRSKPSASRPSSRFAAALNDHLDQQQQTAAALQFVKVSKSYINELPASFTTATVNPGMRPSLGFLALSDIQTNNLLSSRKKTSAIRKGRGLASRIQTSSDHSLVFFGIGTNDDSSPSWSRMKQFSVPRKQIPFYKTKLCQARSPVAALMQVRCVTGQPAPLLSNQYKKPSYSIAVDSHAENKFAWPCDFQTSFTSTCCRRLQAS